MHRDTFGLVAVVSAGLKSFSKPSDRRRTSTRAGGNSDQHISINSQTFFDVLRFYNSSPIITNTITNKHGASNTNGETDITP